MIEFPDKKYQIIYADPPWQYNDKGCEGSAENHYQTMNLEDIKKLPVKDISGTDCTLFLWVTYPLLPEGIDLIKAWGFKYKTIAFQWIKQNKKNGGFFYGIGHWTRSNTECCLLAVKGKPQRASNKVSQLIVSPINRHSKKPGIARVKIVELMGDISRIELFARKEKDMLFDAESYEGWDFWGNEV